MKHNLLNSLFVLMVLLLLGACNNEEWDKHYLQSDERLDENLASFIKGDAELSKFADLLVQSGYDSVLLQDQSFTVWAPVNSAIEALDASVLSDPEAVKQLVGNHISRFAFATTEASESSRIKMLNNKYIQYLNVGGTTSFSDAVVSDGDLLCKNGILHKIDAVAEVRPNIWGEFTSSASYPGMMTYLEQFNFVMFDDINSVVIGQNSLGQSVYDSVFVNSNSYFDVVGNLNSEEERYSFIALSDDIYSSAYDSISQYFKHPDSMVVVHHTENTIYNNLNFPEFKVSDLDGSALSNTVGNSLVLTASDIAVEKVLSNGTLLELSNYPFSAKELIYKPIRYEIETTARRTIGSVTDLTIQKQYDVSASNGFINKVTLNNTPDGIGTNDYFEVAFSNVLSAKYDLYVKYAEVGAKNDTKLRYEVSLMKEGASEPTVYSIPAAVVNRSENGRLKIGETIDVPVFVDDDLSNSYFLKVKVIVDVSEAELVLYGRQFGIDYLELVPAE